MKTYADDDVSKGKTIVFDNVKCVPGSMKIVGAVNIANGCCQGKPVVILKNYVPETRTSRAYWNFSAQCACGLWCTTGTNSASNALKEYERMTADYRAAMRGDTKHGTD